MTISENEKCKIYALFSNVIINVADPEFIHIDGITLNGTIPRGVAVVTKKEFDKIAEVMGYAMPGRFCVGCSYIDTDVRTIDVFDINTDYQIIDTRYFKIKEVE